MQDVKFRDVCNAGVSLEDVHNLNYMEIKQTLYLAWKLDPDMSRELVKKVVRICVRCQCIDPTPIKY